MEKITVTRTFNAPIDKVWEAFTKPETLRKWWSPEGMDSSHISVDLREGGLFRYCFKSPEGSEFWGRGVYQAIAKPTRLSYLDTFTDPDGKPVPPSYYGIPVDKVIESAIDIAFSEDGARTKMNTTMENYFDETMTENMVKGWNGMFDKLALILGSKS